VSGSSCISVVWLFKDDLFESNPWQSRTSQGADDDPIRVWALAAYKDFLMLWKDGDPEIPILKEAKAEYAKSQ
jgi:hypothetical protein